MQEMWTDLINNLKSPSWWVTAVFLAMVLSVVGVYLKTGIDSLLVRVSKRWRERNERVRERWTHLTGQLFGERHAQYLASFGAIHHELRSQSLLLTAVGLGAVAVTMEALDTPRWLTWIAVVVAILSILRSIHHRWRAVEVWLMVKEVNKHLGPFL